MAESVDLDVLVAGDFRGRQPSFHSVHSFQQKVAAKRPAAAPLDFAGPQRARFDDTEITLSCSAPITTSLSLPIAYTALTLPSSQSGTESDGSIADAPVDPTMPESREKTDASVLPQSQLHIVPFDIVNSSSPAREIVEEVLVEEVEEEKEEEAPRRIVRPEDISLFNPDSGLGYRASKIEYHTDDSDDGHDDEDDVENEGEDEVEPEECPPSNPDSPLEEHEIFPFQGEFPVEEVIEGDAEETLPFNTPLDLQLGYDPTVNMGLLMIDPSHQDRFNQLADSNSTGFTAYETLLQQYENENSSRLDQIENALMLNTDFDGEFEGEEVEEIIEEVIEEVYEEEDEDHLPLPPANPPSSPVFLPSSSE